MLVDLDGQVHRPRTAQWRDRRILLTLASQLALRPRGALDGTQAQPDLRGFEHPRSKLKGLSSCYSLRSLEPFFWLRLMS